jgi:hypothetical protein
MAAAMEAAPHPDFALSPRHVGCRSSVEERETVGSAAVARLQSSSASRRTAGACRFFTLSQLLDRPRA